MIRGGLIYPQLQRLGKISIGEKGEVRTSAKGTEFQSPKKLDFFTIRTHYRTEKGQLAIDTEVMERLGKQPRELKIRLPFNDLEKNFQCELRYYKGGMIYCSGDGEQASRRVERVVDGKTVYGDAKPFGPCGRTCPDFQNRNCKRFGALRVILEEQQQVGGVYEYRTTSRHSIENILSGLMTIQLQTGGVLAWLPLTMRLVPQTVMTPENKAMRAYIIQIVFSGSPQHLLETVRDILALRAPLLSEIKALEAGMPTIEDDALEAKETQDEFYPEQSVAMVRNVQAPEDPEDAREVLKQSIYACLRAHFPNDKDGAYDRWIPNDAMAAVRSAFGVEKWAEMKAKSIEALQEGYADLVDTLEPQELVEGDLIDDDDVQDFSGSSDSPIPPSVTSVHGPRLSGGEYIDFSPSDPSQELSGDTQVDEAELSEAVVEIVPPEGEDGPGDEEPFRHLDTDENSHVIQTEMDKLRALAKEQGQRLLLEQMLKETPQMTEGRYRYCWIQIAGKPTPT